MMLIFTISFVLFCCSFFFFFLFCFLFNHQFFSPSCFLICLSERRKENVIVLKMQWKRERAMKERLVIHMVVGTICATEFFCLPSIYVNKYEISSFCLSIYFPGTFSHIYIYMPLLIRLVSQRSVFIR
jgi:hypothetical protein